MLQGSRNRHGTGAFHDQFAPFEDKQHGSCNIFFLNQKHIIDILLDQGKVSFPGIPTAQPSAMVLPDG